MRKKQFCKVLGEGTLQAEVAVYAKEKRKVSLGTQ